MEKLLLATTALVAVTSFASVAAADVKVAGSAEAGFASQGEDGGGTGDMHVYSGATVTVTFSGVSDNGIEFGADLEVEAATADFDPGDWEFDSPAGDKNSDSGVGLGAVYLSYQGAKITFDNNGIDNLYDDDKDSHDVQVGYSAGGISADVTWNVDEDTPESGFEDGGDDDVEMSYKVAYSGGGIEASAAGDDSSAINIAGSYTTGAVTVGVEFDDNGADGESLGDPTVQSWTLSASYDFGQGSVGVEYETENTTADDGETTIDDTVETLTLTASVTSGAVTLAGEYDTYSGDTDDEDYWELTADYAAGGGLNLIAGVNSEEVWYAGAKMKF